jgi:hydroxypyruvate isomerase
MPKFAANLSFLFQDIPFLDRFAAARQAGFEGVEFLFPYEFPAAEIAKRLKDNALTMCLFNVPPGDWNAGERGMACLPERRAEFRENLKRALEYCAELSCPRLHIMAGLMPEGAKRDVLFATMAANLDLAAEEGAKQGVKPLVEPINRKDIPGYFLASYADAIALIEALGPERVGLQHDLYHAQILEGDVTRLTEAVLPYASHMQIADTPGRNEPGTGEVNWDFVLRRIDEMGYRGWIGCEYRPKGTTEAGLGWLAPYRS